MEATQKELLLREMRPVVKELVQELFIESFKKGEMRELFDDLALAKSMEAVEDEEELSLDDALKEIQWK